MTLDLSPLLGLTPEQRRELWLRSSCAYWAKVKRGFVNAPFHNEWYQLLKTENRLCLVAPRDHAKSECVTVNSTSHAAIYRPGIWTYAFAATADQAAELKTRIDQAIGQAEPRMIIAAMTRTRTESVYANGSRVTVAGAGKSVRGVHPDRIIGDDVLNDESTLTEYQRKKTERWWMGAVVPMAHPGTWRVVRGLGKVWFPPTQIVLVGTPFHAADLIMSMRGNRVWHYRRYSAEYDVSQLVPGTWAVEVRAG